MYAITTAPLPDSSSREPQDKNYSSPWYANLFPDQNLLAFVIFSRGLPPTGDSLWPISECKVAMKDEKEEPDIVQPSHILRQLISSLVTQATVS
jgi:hypothetical protein